MAGKPNAQLRRILQQVEKGRLSSDAALKELGSLERDLGFARIDTDRMRRRGLPEVVYGPGKTTDQIIKIAHALISASQDVYVTRVTPEKAAVACAAVKGMKYHEGARALTVDVMPKRKPIGLVSILCAGTSDLPVAEEAALTAERMGAKVERIYDVGVAGLHRLMQHLPTLKKSRALVVVAGMEGALPSVVGGLVAIPVVAVPTSIGYGSHLNGLTPLFAMLNSCASGITVVNIDNGFGAGTAAAMINQIGEPRRKGAR